MPRKTTSQTSAMPQDLLKQAYMSPLQLDFFRQRLVALRNEIAGNAESSTNSMREDTAALADPVDGATQEEEYALELRVRDRERKLLRKVEAALQRVEDGTYGYCLETGEAIGLPRLLVRPSAEYSIEAQERHEKREKTHV